jgi:hypothetical protein
LVPGSKVHHAIPINAISAKGIKQTAPNPMMPTANSERATGAAPKWITSAAIKVRPTTLATTDTAFTPKPQERSVGTSSRMPASAAGAPVPDAILG